MKINRTTDKQLQDSVKSWKPDGGEKAAASAAPGEESKPFEKAVAQKEFKFLDLEVQELVKEVASRGEELKDKQVPERARRYKQALASFLKKALELSRVVEVRQGKRSLSIADLQNKEEKQHRIVKTIDAKLEKLTDSLIEQQEENIDIAEHVDEIKGLVLDLVSTIGEPVE